MTQFQRIISLIDDNKILAQHPSTNSEHFTENLYYYGLYQ